MHCAFHIEFIGRHVILGVACPSVFSEIHSISLARRFRYSRFYTATDPYPPTTRPRLPKGHKTVHYDERTIGPKREPKKTLALADNPDAAIPPIHSVGSNEDVASLSHYRSIKLGVWSSLTPTIAPVV